MYRNVDEEHSRLQFTISRNGEDINGRCSTTRYNNIHFHYYANTSELIQTQIVLHVQEQAIPIGVKLKQDKLDLYKNR